MEELLTKGQQKEMKQARYKQKERKKGNERNKDRKV
jgi:hypothetical protein